MANPGGDFCVCCGSDSETSVWNDSISFVSWTEVASTKLTTSQLIYLWELQTVNLLVFFLSIMLVFDLIFWNAQLISSNMLIGFSTQVWHYQQNQNEVLNCFSQAGFKSLQVRYHTEKGKSSMSGLLEGRNRLIEIKKSAGPSCLLLVNWLCVMLAVSEIDASVWHLDRTARNDPATEMPWCFFPFSDIYFVHVRPERESDIFSGRSWIQNAVLVHYQM